MSIDNSRFKAQQSRNGVHEIEKNKLLMTDDYSLFLVSPFNRDVERMGPLMASMRRHGFIAAYAIHCNIDEIGRLVIKAGHHRFEAAKALGIPLYYIVCDDDASIPDLERATQTWKLRHYVESHARSGHYGSACIAAVSKRTGISESTVASILGGESANSGNKLEAIKNGTFKPSKDGSERMDKVESVVSAMKEAKLTFATKKQFIIALVKMLFLPEFEEAVLIKKLKTNPQLFTNCPTEDHFLEMIEYAYNHSRTVKLPLAFNARQATKSRSAIGKKSRA